MAELSKPTLESLIHRVARQIEPPISDADALKQFIQYRDSDAFTHLLERHGPMVLGVCQRVLGNETDAEDAFQATFLKLARSAKSIHRPESLASWLHQVARQTSIRLKSRRRVIMNDTWTSTENSDPFAEVTWQELRTLLDTEIARLPEELRLPLILCYLEGHTRDEAASQLGWSIRTLMRRLQQGRETLRERLTRQGLAPMGLAAAILSSQGLKASVSPSLASQSTQQVTGKAIVPPHILSLTTNSVLQSWIAGITLSLMLIVGFAFATSQTEVKHPPTDKKEIVQQEKLHVDQYGDLLPEGATARLGTIRYRHPNGVNQSVLSHDGKLIATSGPNRVIVWERETGKQILSFPTESFGKHWIPAIAISPDNKKLVVVPDWNTASLYDIESGKKLSKITLRKNESVMQARFSSNGKDLYFFGHGFLRIQNLETNQPQTHRVKGKVQTISIDEKWFVSIDENKAIIRDVANGKEIQTVELAGSQKISTLALSADKSMIALTGDNPILVDKKYEDRSGEVYRIVFFHLKSGKEIRSLKVPRYWEVKALCFTPDGKYLFAGANRTVYGWNLANEKLTSFDTYIDFIRDVHSTPDGKEVIATGWDGVIRRFDVKTLKEILPQEGYWTQLSSTLSSDAKYAVVADPSGRLHVWDLTTGKRRQDLRPFHNPDSTKYLAYQEFTKTIAFLPNSHLLLNRHDDYQFQVWDIDSGKWLIERTPTYQYKSTLISNTTGSLAITPDGRYLFSTNFDPTSGLEAWDLKENKRLWHVEKSGMGVVVLADGKTIVQTRVVNDGGITFWEWDPKNPTQIPNKRKEITWDFRKRPVEFCQMHPVAASSCGRYLITADEEGLIHLWDPMETKEKAQFKHGSAVRSLAFSPDGKLFAFGDVDGKIIFWESSTMQQVLTRTGHTGWVTHLTFGPAGKSLLSSSHDATALYWDLRPKAAPTSKSIWEDLASTDSKLVYPVLWQCVDDPKGTLELFRSKQWSLPSPHAEQIARWIAKLDAKSFAERELASKSLGELGRIVEPSLREALSKNPSSESKQRLEKLLQEMQKGLTPTELRVLRAVQILEMIGSPEAKTLLQEWAKEKSNLLLQNDAQSALKRLGGMK